MYSHTFLIKISEQIKKCAAKPHTEKRMTLIVCSIISLFQENIKQSLRFYQTHSRNKYEIILRYYYTTIFIFCQQIFMILQPHENAPYNAISLCKSMDGMTHRSFPTVQSPNILKPANYFSITQTTVFMNSSFKIGAFAKGARNFRKGTSHNKQALFRDFLIFF